MPWILHICEYLLALFVAIYQQASSWTQVSISSCTDENPKQHIPVEEYIENLKSIVQYLKSMDIPKNRIILISPPPLCETMWEKECRLQGKQTGWIPGKGKGRFLSAQEH